MFLHELVESVKTFVMSDEYMRIILSVTTYVQELMSNLLIQYLILSREI